MEISDLGEFDLIERIARAPHRKNLLVGIGDDAAVMELKGRIVLTTDMLVEGDHFRREWSTPEQIGRKAMASNISDIASMGAEPAFAFVSLALVKDLELDFIDGLYDGMNQVADQFGVDIAGGDTTHGKVIVINVSVLGMVEKPVLRSGASPGELICSTGDLGGSWAGLELLRAGMEGPAGAIEKHRDPGCRMDVALEIAEYAKAMIDVSDGLASEVNHICDMSMVGAEVIYEDIPMAEHTREAGRLLEKDPALWALNGGEDFELVFTIASKDLPKVDHLCTVVGRTLEPDQGRHLIKDGDRFPLKGGFTHF